jgi:hypothetical protein
MKSRQKKVQPKRIKGIVNEHQKCDIYGVRYSMKVISLLKVPVVVSMHYGQGQLNSVPGK